MKIEWFDAAMRGLCLALYALPLAGCIIPTEAAFPGEAAAFDAPPEFAVWWRVTESCSGLQRDYTKVAWYVVPDGRLVVGGHSYDGYSWSNGNPRIVLSQSMLHGAGDLVRHEMLHVLIGQGGHSKEFFRIRCGDVVACVDECADGAGTWSMPDARSPIVDPRALVVSLSAEPSLISRGTDAWMSVVLTVHNPSKERVWVRLPDGGSPEVSAPGVPFHYGFWIESREIGSISTLPDFNGLPLVPFDAGQTRRIVFDTTPFFPDHLPLGISSVSGGFSTNTATPVQIRVVP